MKEQEMEKTVHVGGLPYPAREDDKGRLRFVKDPDHPLVKRMMPIFGGTGSEDPNTIGLEYGRGEHSLRDYAEMNIAMGYSIDGFEDLSSFEEIEVRCDVPHLCRAGRRFGPEDEIPKAG
ncbi:hypothetical protein [uncultured Salinicola sp.]|uniref:hypothetical protein n=1 Tax=uncultured Salinicola sp. TaxID=1193542 RepID=UPI002635A82F|nr:hypothetical protein [uncultured Salinicola sp.]|tara:strand:+ start:5764 stop:6123 length:360 start_codon:yes stop_codon:yes gene_type:complete